MGTLFKALLLLMLTISPALADNTLEQYTEGFNKGWNSYYKQFTDLEKEEIPSPPSVIQMKTVDDDFSLEQCGVIDGLNAAGEKVIRERWDGYSFWRKWIEPEDWFLVNVIFD